MKLRAPSVPLITVDPYFSVWSPYSVLNHKATTHWTGAPNDLIGLVNVDGDERQFLGYFRNFRKIEQVYFDMDALTSRYKFRSEKIELEVDFMTPLLLSDFDILTRPVSYITVRYTKIDPAVKSVSVKIYADNSLCLNARNEKETEISEVKIDGITAMKMGAVEQKPLNRSGDNLRIDWGYVYLAAKGEARCGKETLRYMKAMYLDADLSEGEERLFMLAYDDLGASINYFGKTLPSYWNRNGMKIEEAILAASNEYFELRKKCDEFSKKLCEDAKKSGGEKYADLLTLAYRQVLAAHKLAVDDNGELLYISKECFSNGCAATVDVSYPSIPIFLQYCPTLVKAMLRPIYKFATDERWKFDFAPHDAGQYPLVTGQVYGLDKATGELLFDMQMPVEECGNMIIMEANIALREGNAEFAKEHIDILKSWCEYLIKYGNDPENQLCTDDFAGHLAHNCNLTVKAIMGCAGMSIICNMLGMADEAKKYMQTAKENALSWIERARNADGSFKLAFDKEGSYSMKYNMVWDKIWGTNLFAGAIDDETESYFGRMNKYGLVLDSRCDQTKSDWLVWCATMTRTKKQFEKLIAPLWKFYNETPDRVPMTDWYDTNAGTLIGFIHRTVQGGLFIKLLSDSKSLSAKNI